MMIITSTLLSAFRYATMVVFVDEMVEYCRTACEEDCEHFADEELREVVEVAIEAAANYGFTLRGPVRLYIELSLMFGTAFDSDPQYLWLTEILSGDEFITEEDRADALHEAVCDYIDAVGSEAAQTVAFVATTDAAWVGAAATPGESRS